MPVETEQSLEEGIDDPPLRLAGDQRGIKSLGFRTVDECKIGPRLARMASSREQKGHRKQQTCLPPHEGSGTAWAQGSPEAKSVKFRTVISAMFRSAWSVRKA